MGYSADAGNSLVLHNQRQSHNDISPKKPFTNAEILKQSLDELVKGELFDPAYLGEIEKNNFYSYRKNRRYGTLKQNWKL